MLDKLAEEGFEADRTLPRVPRSMHTFSGMVLVDRLILPVLAGTGGVVGYGIKPVNGLAPEARTMGEVACDAGYRSGLDWQMAFGG